MFIKLFLIDNAVSAKQLKRKITIQQIIILVVYFIIFGAIGVYLYITEGPWLALPSSSLKNWMASSDLFFIYPMFLLVCLGFPLMAIGKLGDEKCFISDISLNEVTRKTGIVFDHLGFNGVSLSRYDEYSQRASLFIRESKLLLLPTLDVVVQEKREDDLGVIYKLVTRYPTVVWLVGKDYLGNVWANRVPESFCCKSLEQARRWILGLDKKDKIVKEV